MSGSVIEDLGFEVGTGKVNKEIFGPMDRDSVSGKSVPTPDQM